MKTKTSKKKVIVAPVGQAPSAPVVRFGLDAPEAKQVFVAGTFNDWHPSVSEMFLASDGRWHKELTLPAGVYEYRFVVDGQWADDPRAGETVQNAYGGWNAVLRVSG